jgi:hypothetical protein
MRDRYLGGNILVDVCVVEIGYETAYAREDPDKGKKKRADQWHGFSKFGTLLKAVAKTIKWFCVIWNCICDYMRRSQGKLERSDYLPLSMVHHDCQPFRTSALRSPTYTGRYNTSIWVDTLGHYPRE